MKKIICILIALITIMSLVSCIASNVDPTDTSVPDTATGTTAITDTPSERIEYTVYRSENTSLVEPSDEVPPLPDGLAVEPIADFFNIDMYSESLKSEDAEKTITFKFLDNEYDLEYFDTKRSDFYNCPSAELKRDKLNHTYMTADKKVTFEIEDSTDRVLYFTNSTIKHTDHGEMNYDQAVAKAEEIIKSIYGENALNGYALNTERNNPDDDYYHIVFERSIENSKTVFDFINLGITNEGKVRFFNTNNFGVLDNVWDKITDESVEQACNHLLSLYPVGAQIKSIEGIGIIPSVGKVCMLVNITYQTEGKTTTNSLYINLH